MVCEWKPNSSRDVNEPRLPTLEGPSVLDQANENGNAAENEIDLNLGAYQLLPSDAHQAVQAPSVETDDSGESEYDTDSSDSADAAASAPVNLNTARLEGWEKSEIDVDCDEIRSLMSGFRLPESSVPDWASSVPEASFSSFVWTKLKPDQL